MQYVGLYVGLYQVARLNTMGQIFLLGSGSSKHQLYKCSRAKLTSNRVACFVLLLDISVVHTVTGYILGVKQCNFSLHVELLVLTEALGTSKLLFH